MSKTPKLRDLLGAAPNLTGGLSSEEYIRRKRAYADLAASACMEDPLSQIPPADPTPSAAVAPTGGETEVIRRARDEMTRLCHRRGYAAPRGLVGRDWTMSIPVREDDSDVIFAALANLAERLSRAALSSPVRAEPTDSEHFRDLMAAILNADTPEDEARRWAEFDAAVAALALPVRAERGEAGAWMLDGLEMAWVILANVNGGRWEETAPDWHAAVVRWRDEYMPRVSALLATRAALTPTPPATPTEPTDA